MLEGLEEVVREKDVVRTEEGMLSEKMSGSLSCERVG